MNICGAKTMLFKNGKVESIDLKRYNLIGTTPFSQNVPFFAKHVCPYVLIRDFCIGKDILEIGIGDGYGLHYLCGFADKYAGIDLDSARLLKAKTEYNLRNTAIMDGINLGFKSGIFDVVYSFHVIEHILESQVEQFLRETSRVLKPKGIFVCATPNLEKNRKYKGDKYQIDPLHAKEYVYSDLRRLLESVFPKVEIYSFLPTTKHSFFLKLKKVGLLKYNLCGRNPVKKFYENISTGDFMVSGSNLKDAVDFIGVCQS
jgi:SAM-dependent methyltransferase